MDPSKAPIDRTHLEDVSGGDREFEAELMLEFVSSTPSLLSGLGRALEDGDLEQAQMSAHTLKGSCRSLGAVAMAEPCSEIEQNAREGSLRGSSDLFHQACAHYQALCAYIEKTWNVKAA